MRFVQVILLCAAVVAALTEDIKYDGFGRQIGFSERVVGGAVATPHSAPWVCSMQWFIISGTHLCGSVLISNEWVLTAAHCLDGAPNIGSIHIACGRHQLNVVEGTEQRRNADQTIRHPDYLGGVNPFDIALIHVTVPFQLNAVVNTIGLPAPGFIHAGLVTLHGWGSTSTTNVPSMPNILHTVTKPILPFAQCEAVFGGPGASPLHSTNVCTGPLSGGISACSGDSGGPLVQGNQLVGIVSWGIIPCGSVNAPSVYVRVSAFNAWIASHTGISV